MKAKLTFLAGLAAGYVLGTRAGRSSYEKIKSSVKSMWANDAVQETITVIKDQTEEAAQKLVQKAQPTHISTPDPRTGSGANPLDIVPEVSDEFPDAALSGGEGQKRSRRNNPDAHLPWAES